MNLPRSSSRSSKGRSTSCSISSRRTRSTSTTSPIAPITDQYLAYLEHLRGAESRRRRRVPGDGGDADADQVAHAAAGGRGRATRRRTIRAPIWSSSSTSTSAIARPPAELADRDVLARDVFRRSPEEPESETRELPRLRELDLADLVDALREVLKRLPQEQAARDHRRAHPIADRIPCPRAPAGGRRRVREPVRRALVAPRGDLDVPGAPRAREDARGARAASRSGSDRSCSRLAVPRDAEYLLDFKDDNEG